MPKSWEISRRHLLRGVGATISLPFLEAMTVPSAEAAAGTSPNGMPLRFAAFFMPDGVNHAQFVPKGNHLSELPPILAPLSGLNAYVNVISGMNNADRGHAAGTSAFVTGQSPKKTGKPSEVNVRNPSLDQVIARAVGRSTVFPSLELGMHTAKSGVSMSGHSHIYTSYVCWRNATTPIPHEIDPRRAFDRLFRNVKLASGGSGKNKAGATGKRPPIAMDKSVLDLVLEDAKGLRRRLGREDQRKLDEYLTAVREVEQRISGVSSAATKELHASKSVLDEIRAVDQKLNRAFEKGGADGGKGRYRVGPNLPYQEHGRLLMDVMALAFWSNSTSVSTLMFGDGLNGRNMSFLPGVDGNHHSISHHGYKPAGLRKFSIINKFFMAQYGYFLERLRGMEERGGNVLDNSVVLLGSNISSGQKHGGENIPLLLSGKAGGKLKGNRHIRAKGQHIGRLHRSILELMGVESTIGAGKGTLDVV